MVKTATNVENSGPAGVSGACGQQGKAGDTQVCKAARLVAAVRCHRHCCCRWTSDVQCLLSRRGPGWQHHAQKDTVHCKRKLKSAADQLAHLGWSHRTRSEKSVGRL